MTDPSRTAQDQRRRRRAELGGTRRDKAPAQRRLATEQKGTGAQAEHRGQARA
jgi:hypothetical protein